MPLNRRAVIFGLATTGLGFAGRAIADVQSIGGSAFGSSWRVVTQTGVDKARIAATVAAVVTEVDGAMSPYRADSPLSRFNRGAAGVWHGAPPALSTVARAALRMAQMTGGAFDPTVGPLVSRFGFGPISGGPGRYSDIEIADAALRKTGAELTLDLCGIAKGFALDQITGALRRDGITNALVELGGEVRALGAHPDGRAWQVAVADPAAPDFKVQRIVLPGRFALATSGHASNGVRGALNASHIIDPQNRRSADPSLLSVSVLAPSAMQADALATAFCAAGAVAGPALARRLQVPALFITDGAEAAPEILTGAFARHILI